MKQHLSCMAAIQVLFCCFFKKRLSSRGCNLPFLQIQTQAVMHHVQCKELTWSKYFKATETNQTDLGYVLLKVLEEFKCCTLKKKSSMLVMRVAVSPVTILFYEHYEEAERNKLFCYLFVVNRRIYLDLSSFIKEVLLVIMFRNS